MIITSPEVIEKRKKEIYKKNVCKYAAGNYSLIQSCLLEVSLEEKPVSLPEVQGRWRILA